MHINLCDKKNALMDNLLLANRLQIAQQNIVQMSVDAIVNAANTSLLGGGGVDGAIHRAAGADLVAECRMLNGCKVGEAKITKGYRLPAPYIIHTVGPRWNGGTHNEAQLLANAYHNSLLLAAQHQLQTIAFPNISTGIYGYPKQQAAQIALQTVVKFAQQNTLPQTIIFVCFDDENYQIYQNLLPNLITNNA